MNEVPATPAKAPPPGTAGRIRRLALKELRETLRDRRTILTLVLMPVLVYPLLSLVFQRFLLSSLTTPSDAVYHIGVETPKDGMIVASLMMTGEQSLSYAEDGAPLQKRETSDLREGGAEIVPLQVVARQNLVDAVAAMDVDVGVRLQSSGPIELPLARVPEVDCEILVLKSSRTSRDAAHFVERRLNALRDRELTNRLRIEGVEGRAAPVEVSARQVLPLHGRTAFSLSALVPLILILMTITGAVYPAIDLTAGERERGTLEALIAAPVPRLGLLTAKYVAVVTVAVLNATVNLVSMAVTISAVGLGAVLFGEKGLTASLIASVFGLMILFAAFFSAVLLAVTSFARSFKEAQAYLIPLMLVSLAPGIIALLPGIEFNAYLAVTPLLNIVLLARDLCEQRPAHAVLVVAVVVSTGLFAAAALSVAARIFGADAILYGSRGSWSELFRRPAEPVDRPTAGSALFCLAALFPAFFLLSHLLARVSGIEERLAASAGMTILLFAGIPIAAALLRKVRLPGGLGVRRFSPAALAGIALLGASVWAFAFELVMFAELFGFETFDPALRKRAEELLAAWKTVPLWMIVLSLAVVPGLCEELFFRGFLLTSLRTRLAAWPAILLSALLFGAFHVVMADGLATIRFLPSACLGILLGWVYVRTGSVIPGMLLHAIHNGLLVAASHSKDELMARGWGIEASSHLPVKWLAAAALAILAGVAIVACTRPVEPPAREGVV